MKIAQWFLAAFLLGGLVGFVPMYLQYHEASATLAALEPAAAVSDAHSRMAQLLLAVRDEKWSDAQALSSAAFEAVEAAQAISTDPDTSRRLMTAAQARDEITAQIATGDRQSVQSIRRIVDLLTTSLDEL